MNTPHAQGEGRCMCGKVHSNVRGKCTNMLERCEAEHTTNSSCHPLLVYIHVQRIQKDIQKQTAETEVPQLKEQLATLRTQNQELSSWQVMYEPHNY